MNKTVDTRICEITVYENQALVTRKGLVQLTGEERELVIAQLPTTLVSESLRASGKGAVAVRLLGVRCELSYIAEKEERDLTPITQEIEQLEEQRRQLQDELTQLNLQRNFVKNLSSQYLERLTRIQNPEPLNLTQIKDLLDFVGDQHNEYSQAIAQKEKEQKQLDKQLQILRQQLQQLSPPPPQECFNIIVSIEPSSAGEFELEVSYVVDKASWTPLYDLRLSATSDNLNLSYLAEVQQSSGEDWLDVALTLSTAKPGLGSLPPKLPPWYIDIYNPKPLAMMRSVAENYEMMPFPGMAPQPSAKRDEELDQITAQVAIAEVLKQGGVINFGINSGGNIPNDGTPHKTTIFNEDYPCRAEYIAIPRLVSLAYLQVKILNPLTGVTLLPAKANIFRENTFVGTTELEQIAPGQEFKLNLGIDEGLKIERDLVERQVEKKLIGTHRRTTYAYRMLITNLREQEADLTLTEQLPVSRNEQIKVRLTRTNPQIEIGEMGMLEWSLTLPPQSKQELYYQFTVEHPPDINVTGLDI
jgi:uncharacterized protein (TIGR02231 family)